MKKTKYRLSSIAVHDIAVAAAHAENMDEIGLSRRQNVIARALRYSAGVRQRECICLYFARGLNQTEIAKHLGITTSTVSRSITFGVRKIEKALLLAGMEGLHNGTTAD